MSQAAYETGTVPPETTGWRLQRALSFADVSVEQMSAELGVSRSTVSRWLNDRGTPSLGYLKIWALRTGTPYSWLKGDEGSSGSHIRALIRDQQPGYAEIHNDITAMRKALGRDQRRPSNRAPVVTIKEGR